MCCDVGEAFRHFTYVTEHSLTLPSLYLHHSSFSNPSLASPTSQLILQPFFRFSYVTGSSLTSPGEPPMVRYRAGSRDEMRCSSFTEGLWLTRMPADHAWRTTPGVDEIKWITWVWRNGGMKFVQGKTRETPRKTYPDSLPFTTKPIWPRPELGTPARGVWWASCRLHHGAAHY